MSLAPLLALHEALQEAEQFVAGFENDPHQETDVGLLLKKLRGQVDVVRVTIDTQRAQAAAEAANATLPAPEQQLASCDLSPDEYTRWTQLLDPLIKYAGRPGDWGRQTALGMLTMRLLQVRETLKQQMGEAV